MPSRRARLHELTARAIFWARRRFLEPTLDPAQDSVVLPIATHSPWLLDAEFQRIHAQIRSHTLVDPYRCWELWHLVGQLRALEGDVLEVGVWRGGTGALIAARLHACAADATVHLCDTFAGVVKAGEADSHYRGGEHADTSVETVRELMSRVGVERYEIHRGVFPDSAPATLAERRFRMAHIDVDVYESGREVFEWVWPRLSVGGIVVFDDYGFSTTRGITRLCRELEDRSDAVEIQNLNGHALVVRIR